MKRRMKKLNNDGYSLVELIIVIAIIAVFTVAAYATLATIHTAKAKEASMSFENAVSELVSNTKGKSYDFNGDGKVDKTDEGYNFGLKVYSDGKKCYLQEVIIRDGAYVSDSTFESANNLNNGKGTNLSSYVYCTFTPKGGAEVKITDTDIVYIYFNKDGTCASGIGTYRFYRNNGSSIAKVTINANGSRISK